MNESTKHATLDDGTPATILTQAQVDVLLEMIEERLWWYGATKRFRRMGVWAGWVATALVMMSVWWPWLSRVLAAMITELPK